VDKCTVQYSVYLSHHSWAGCSKVTECGRHQPPKHAGVSLMAVS